MALVNVTAACVAPPSTGDALLNLPGVFAVTAAGVAGAAMGAAQARLIPRLEVNAECVAPPATGAAMLTQPVARISRQHQAAALRGARNLVGTGHRLAVANAGPRLVLVDFSGKDAIRTPVVVSLPGEVDACVSSPEGDIFALVRTPARESYRLYAFAPGLALQRYEVDLPEGVRATAIAYGEDAVFGDFLVLPLDGGLAVFDAATGREIARAEGGTAETAQLAVWEQPRTQTEQYNTERCFHLASVGRNAATLTTYEFQRGQPGPLERVPPPTRTERLVLRDVVQAAHLRGPLLPRVKPDLAAMATADQLGQADKTITPYICAIHQRGAGSTEYVIWLGYESTYDWAVHLPEGADVGANEVPVTAVSQNVAGRPLLPLLGAALVRQVGRVPTLFFPGDNPYAVGFIADKAALLYPGNSARVLWRIKAPDGPLAEVLWPTAAATVETPLQRTLRLPARQVAQSQAWDIQSDAVQVSRERRLVSITDRLDGVTELPGRRARSHAQPDQDLGEPQARLRTAALRVRGGYAQVDGTTGTFSFHADPNLS